MNAFEQAKIYSEHLFAIREQIHRNPETGNREFLTADLVEKTLNALGIETKRVTATGIVGMLKGDLPGPAAALRADMDALPVAEETGSPFASGIPGMMHACGHDVHTAAVLGAAMILSEQRKKLCGSVRFFFEPDEEGYGGAARMIAAGCMEGVDVVFGAHVAPDLPMGVIGVRYGKFYAASDLFTVKIHGRPAHGAQPEKGIDALAAAAETVCKVRRLPAERISDPSVLNVGKFTSGTADNIVADTAEFSGTMRTLGPADRAALKQAFCETVEQVSSKYGAKSEIKFHESYGGIVNTDEETQLVQQRAETLFGKSSVRVITTPTMTTEDFGCFIDAAKGSFYHIGAGCSAPLHSSRFLPEPDTIIRLAALHADIIWHYLLQKAVHI